MNFKVGQRVKVIANHSEHLAEKYGSWGLVGENLTGHEGVVLHIGARRRVPELPVQVQLDGDSAPAWFAASELAPLTDPKADAFIADIKKLKPLDTYTEHFAEVWRELTGIQR